MEAHFLQLPQFFLGWSLSWQDKISCICDTPMPCTNCPRPPTDSRQCSGEMWGSGTPVNIPLCSRCRNTECITVVSETIAIRHATRPWIRGFLERTKWTHGRDDKSDAWIRCHIKSHKIRAMLNHFPPNSHFNSEKCWRGVESTGDHPKGWAEVGEAQSGRSIAGGFSPAKPIAIPTKTAKHLAHLTMKWAKNSPLLLLMNIFGPY